MGSWKNKDRLRRQFSNWYPLGRWARARTRTIAARGRPVDDDNHGGGAVWFLYIYNMYIHIRVCVCVSLYTCMCIYKYVCERAFYTTMTLFSCGTLRIHTHTHTSVPNKYTYVDTPAPVFYGRVRVKIFSFLVRSSRENTTTADGRRGEEIDSVGFSIRLALV